MNEWQTLCGWGIEFLSLLFLYATRNDCLIEDVDGAKFIKIKISGVKYEIIGC